MLSEPMKSTTAVRSLRSSTMISHVSRQPTGGLMATGDAGDVAARLPLALSLTGEPSVSWATIGTMSGSAVSDADCLRVFLGAGDSKSSGVADAILCDAARLCEALIVRGA
jgi:hypothetical protein